MIRNASITLILIMALTSALAACESYDVASNSMLPVLKKGQSVTCARSSAKTAQPGDIIVYRHPKLDSTHVKTVIGLAGDTVEMRGGKLYINAHAVETRSAGEFKSDDMPGVEALRSEETLPNGVKILVLDTGQANPMDNTPAFTVEPGHVFVLGNNRDMSIDSRDKGHGLVPASNIVCTAASPS